MLQRVRIQILDSPVEWVMLDREEFGEPVRNKALADALRSEMNRSYPSLVSVEYIDLFDSDDSFLEVRQLVRQGDIHVPVVMINGIPKIHGGIPPAVIKAEVEKIMSSGPVH